MNHSLLVRSMANKLFDENKIDVFIGYRYDTENDIHVPFICKGKEEVETLVFDDKSAFNLTRFLTKPEIKDKRAGILLKGCDSRALNMLLTEGQIKRDNLYIIGVCCEGILDENGNLEGRCSECVMPDPILSDEIIGDPSGIRPYKESEEVNKLLALSDEERQAFFNDIFSSCVRCNACRMACPLCYCETCIIDQESATFMNAAPVKSNSAMMLLTWSLHLAGRCVDCRNCERACQNNLPLHLLHKYNEMVIYKNFEQHLAGLKPDDRGAFYKFNPNDPDKFIM
jgi:formate dehydrogenase (coenzyme F420) beta subunit